jgi:hypothetical protein
VQLADADAMCSSRAFDACVSELIKVDVAVLKLCKPRHLRVPPALNRPKPKKRRGMARFS